jgi:spore coat polysaccharide biosynthesis predicted glycosyltransferase SpsG
VKRLNIAFYTEAGAQRGMGHLIRCYSLYEECKRFGMNGSFFLDSDIDFSYKFSDLHSFKWDDFHIDDFYDIVVIDSYEASIDIYNIIAKSVHVPLFIDDYGRLKYPQGVIINFAPDAEELFFRHKNPENTYLLGVNYIPLRRDILTANPIKKDQIFIMLGGNDTFNISQTIIQALDDIDLLKVIVVNNEATAETLRSYPNVKVLHKPSDTELLSEMAGSSLAISTASMSTYEFAYFKIPTIICALSENQKIGSMQLLRHHLASYLIDITDNHWAKKFQQYLTSPAPTDLRPIIDGKGTQRIVEFMTRMAEQ